jgi:hypothetical protein
MTNSFTMHHINIFILRDFIMFALRFCEMILTVSMWISHPLIFNDDIVLPCDMP